MDGNRFDDLTKGLASATDRRQFIRAFVGSVAGGVAALLGISGASGAELRLCRGLDRNCRSNADCCSGFCPNTTYKCACPAGTIPCAGACIPACTPLDQCHIAGVCNPATGQCTNPIKPNNTPCNDNNLCTQTDTCQNGTCVGSNPVQCTALDQCHDAGTCDPTTGLCSNPPKPNGTACDDGNPCTTNDTCQNGVCTGTPVVCPAPQVCQNGTCVCPSGTTLCGSSCCTAGETCQNGACVCVGGNPCTSPADCCGGSGTCINGVCSVGACLGASCGNFTQCNVIPTADCQCYTTPEGAGVCGCNTPCAGIQPCAATTDCPTGFVCVVNSCCGAAGVCVSICTPSSTCHFVSSLVTPLTRGGGSTAGH
jgi:hypothetical protein